MNEPYPGKIYILVNQGLLETVPLLPWLSHMLTTLYDGIEGQMFVDVCARWTFQRLLNQVVLAASVQSSIGSVQRKEVLKTYRKSEIQNM